MKTGTQLLLVVLCLLGLAANGSAKTIYKDTIPLAGNTYLTAADGKANFSDKGILRWENGKKAVFSTYFKIGKPGKLVLALKGTGGQGGTFERDGKTYRSVHPDGKKGLTGKSEIKITAGGKSFTVKLTGNEPAVYPVGTVKIPEAGYVRIDLEGISHTEGSYPQLDCFLIGGEAAEGEINCVKNFSTYWGRRGPSVHMNYELPREKVQYFYNEVTVPEGEDVMNSYFMAAGFGEGYFGMQVNSATERRILFSVWSPFNTDDPSSIPPEKRIVKLRQGNGVHIGEFGNEGSGGQSFLVYPWKAGQTYKFLAEVKPDGNNNTIYTAYFFAPDDRRWHLIASFKRPETDTHYTHAHSFLENFNPAMGYIPRTVYFSNQWARTVDGQWIELTKGTFTCDATGNAGVRKDFAGGVNNGMFFLKNCGFFNETTPYRSKFERPAQGKIPQIDWEELEKL